MVIVPVFRHCEGGICPPEAISSTRLGIASSPLGLLAMTIEAIKNTAQVRRVWKDTGNDSFMNGQ